jgi:hypothetical protein
MGLILSVYKSKIIGDCTNNGITANADMVCVVNIPGPFEPDKDCPAVLLVNREGIVVLYPAVLQGSTWFRRTGWHMMGGNYAASSDSRFSRACEGLLGHPFYGAVPIHDRIEHV